MKSLVMNDWYFWNFRTTANKPLQAIKRSEHRPEFIHCMDQDGKEFCVHEENLTEEKVK